MKVYKVVVAGPFNAGKTTLIKTLCGNILSTESSVSHPYYRGKKSMTTTALDFGILRLDSGRAVKLFGTPGQDRFYFMWKTLTRGMQGYILMLDRSHAESIGKARLIYRDFRRNFPSTPHVIVANKYDKRHVMDLETLRNKLGTPPQYPLIPLCALDYSSALGAVRILLSLVDAVSEVTC